MSVKVAGVIGMVPPTIAPSSVLSSFPSSLLSTGRSGVAISGRPLVREEFKGPVYLSLLVWEPFLAYASPCPRVRISAYPTSNHSPNAKGTKSSLA